MAGQAEGYGLEKQMKQQLLKSIHAGGPIAPGSILNSVVTRDHLGRCVGRILDEKVPRIVDEAEMEDKKNWCTSRGEVRSCQRNPE